MVIYKCTICAKTFDKKSNYQNHKNRKNPCSQDYKSIAECSNYFYNYIKTSIYYIYYESQRCTEIT